MLIKFIKKKKKKSNLFFFLPQKKVKTNFIKIDHILPIK